MLVPAALQIHGTCLGFQLLHILVSNVSRNDLLIETDSVAHPANLEWTPAGRSSRLFEGMPVGSTCTTAQSTANNSRRLSDVSNYMQATYSQNVAFIAGQAASQCSLLHLALQNDLFTKLEDPTLNIALENHEYGMPPSFYKRWPILDQWFNILTTTKDRNGTVYISTMEAKKYPFTGKCRTA